MPNIFKTSKVTAGTATIGVSGSANAIEADSERQYLVISNYGGTAVFMNFSATTASLGVELQANTNFEIGSNNLYTGPISFAQSAGTATLAWYYG